MNNLKTSIPISHKWLVWRQKRGRYAKREMYVSLCLGSNNKETTNCMLAGIKDNKITMHKTQMTYWQIAANTTELKDKELIKRLEEKFKEYEKEWVVRKAKKILISL